MSGHSHWATTKHAKAAADAKKGKIFSRIAKEIMLAAKVNGDPNTNPALRTLVEKGRKANMPKDNIENAIKKGTGELAGAAAFEEITYEGYAAGGVGLIVNVLTDNKNRAAAEVGNVFKKNGIEFAKQGSATRLFDRLGQIMIPAASSPRRAALPSSASRTTSPRCWRPSRRAASAWTRRTPRSVSCRT